MKFVLIKDDVDTIDGEDYWYIDLCEKGKEESRWSLLAGWMLPDDAIELSKELGAEICEPQKK